MILKQNLSNIFPFTLVFTIRKLFFQETYLEFKGLGEQVSGTALTQQTRDLRLQPQTSGCGGKEICQGTCSSTGGKNEKNLIPENACSICPSSICVKFTNCSPSFYYICFPFPLPQPTSTKDTGKRRTGQKGQE